MTDYLDIETRYELGIYPKRDIVLVKGKNAKVWDQNGKQYIDCVAGNGVANIGHCNAAVVAAIYKQAETLITCPGIFYNDMRAILLEKLVGIAPGNLARAFLCNSGTESIEAAIKFARYATGKTDLICCMRGFHGRSMGALSATFNSKYREAFQPLVPGFRHVPFNNFPKLAEAITENTAAVLLEVVQGEGGVNIAKSDFLQDVRKVCTEKGIVLIIDEVQTGFCRTGKMFACEHFDVQPDILCLAKGIAGGIPMGAVLCSENIEIPGGKHGSTFGGNPLACAAAAATIDYLRQNKVAEQARKKGAYLVKQLHGLDTAVVREVRHLGLMVGIELREKVKPFILKLLDAGVLVLPAGSTVLRLLPPLTISHAELDIVAREVTNTLKK